MQIGVAFMYQLAKALAVLNVYCASLIYFVSLRFIVWIPSYLQTTLAFFKYCNSLKLVWLMF